MKNYNSRKHRTDKRDERNSYVLLIAEIIALTVLVSTTIAVISFPFI